MTPTITCLDDLPDCTRPFIFEHDSEEFPYSTCGTGFLVRRDGQLLVVTANHVFRGYSVSDVRIPIQMPHPDLLPIDGETHDSHPDAAQRDGSDLRILRVAESLVTQAHREVLRAIDLSVFECSTKGLRPGDALLIAGYPDYRRDIDYDRSDIRFGSVLLEATYVGPAGYDVSIHELRFMRPAGLQSMQGLSGSPVFLVRLSRSGKLMGQLAGVLIRGNADAGTGFFISGDMLARFLDAGRIQADESTSS